MEFTINKESGIAATNFTGAVEEWNPAGHKNFVLFLTEEDRLKCEKLGIRYQYAGANETDPVLKVGLNFGFPGTAVALKKGSGMIVLDGHDVLILDHIGWVIENLILTSKTFEFQGQEFHKAFVKTLIVRRGI